LWSFVATNAVCGIYALRERGAGHTFPTVTAFDTSNALHAAALDRGTYRADRL
jgi:hypothetical protein